MPNRVRALEGCAVWAVWAVCTTWAAGRQTMHGCLELHCMVWYGMAWHSMAGQGIPVCGIAVLAILVCIVWSVMLR